MDPASEGAQAGAGRTDIRGSQGVLAGTGGLQVNVFGVAPEPAPARSMYLHQVRQIAPPQLAGREAELAELGRFCQAPDGRAYAWWQAAAWAGKSALLSTFVLRAATVAGERVRVVSFFITARLAAQDTRQAFTQVIAEQLAELLGESLPPVLPEPTREAALLGLMSRAAAACRKQGGRLVLVVDGLDEDRGVSTGPDARSIAGLLPADPPAGMRVIVAGRPNPPVPDDVPDWHPLRDPATVRPLASSPHARDARRLGNQELQRLLKGSAAELDMLGLLTAARGGLSGRDLAELAGIPLWEAEEILHTAAGRTFTRRPSSWALAAGLEVYLLGHEELQAAAERYLDGRLAAYRDRVHAWAGGYRARGWPAETPEYLLTGYPALLNSLGDLPRMTANGLDQVLHDRMLAVTGGDAAARADITVAMDLTAAQDDPDLGNSLALAYCRDRLTGRNSRVPRTLPAVWAALGHASRAEVMAMSISEPGAQAAALAEVARALALSAQYEQVTAAAELFEAAAASAGDSLSLSGEWRTVAWALARAGRREQALTAARSVTHYAWLGTGLTEVALGLAEAGLREAADVTRLVTVPSEQARLLAEVALEQARAGQHDQARTTAEQAETAARSITTSSHRASVLATVALALVQAGHPDQARTTAEQAEIAAGQPGTEVIVPTDAGSLTRTLARIALALALAGHHEKSTASAAQAVAVAQAPASVRPTGGAGLTDAVRALAQAGHHEQARSVACSVANGEARAKALADVALALAQAGDHQQAQALADDASEVAASVFQTGARARALAHIARALAQAGYHERAGTAAAAAAAAAQAAAAPARPVADAEALADVVRLLVEAGHDGLAEAVSGSITGPDELAAVALALALVGRREQARDLAVRAETTARSLAGRGLRAAALPDVVWALARAGHYERAEAAASSIAPSLARTWALADVALAQANDYPRAKATIRSIAEPGVQARVLADVARSLLRAGHDEHAEDAARSIASPLTRTWALGGVACGLAGTGQADRARAVAGEAVQAAHCVTDPDAGATALAYAARALVQAGNPERGTAVAREAELRALAISSAEARAWALAHVAQVLARAGHQQLTGQAGRMARAIDGAGARAWALTCVARALAHAGDRAQAVSVAAEAEQAARSIEYFVARRGWTLALIARVLVLAGQYEQAEAMARTATMPHLDNREKAVSDLARPLAQAGRYEQAETAARSIGSERARAAAFTGIATALGQAGRYEQAEAVARSITAPAPQAMALARTAEALAQTARNRPAPDITRAAIRLAVETCSRLPWGAAARTAHLVDPRSLEVLSLVLEAGASNDRRTGGD